MKPSRLVVAALALLIFGAITSHADTFTQVSTSFGSGTALEDNSTGIEWLDLSLTNDQSYNYLEANLAPGGVYAGWSYATSAELTQFFTDFDGGVVDNALALSLMNDLGGPLGNFYNPANGFMRQSSMGLLDVPFGLGHAQYGYIAVDNFFGPSIDPALQGSQVDSFANPIAGSWLVMSSAPEPSSLALCLVGLGMLFLLGRRHPN